MTALWPTALIHARACRYILPRTEPFETPADFSEAKSAASTSSSAPAASPATATPKKGLVFKPTIPRSATKTSAPGSPPSPSPAPLKKLRPSPVPSPLSASAPRPFPSASRPAPSAAPPASDAPAQPSSTPAPTQPPAPAPAPAPAAPALPSQPPTTAPAPATIPTTTATAPPAQPAMSNQALGGDDPMAGNAQDDNPPPAPSANAAAPARPQRPWSPALGDQAEEGCCCVSRCYQARPAGLLLLVLAALLLVSLLPSSDLGLESHHLPLDHLQILARPADALLDSTERRSSSLLLPDRRGLETMVVEDDGVLVGRTDRLLVFADEVGELDRGARDRVDGVVEDATVRKEVVGFVFRVAVVRVEEVNEEPELVVDDGGEVVAGDVGGGDEGDGIEGFLLAGPVPSLVALGIVEMTSVRGLLELPCHEMTSVRGLLELPPASETGAALIDLPGLAESGPHGFGDEPDGAELGGEKSVRVCFRETQSMEETARG
ncbi:uncharacterized protein MKK02DRAFT_28284 [Dioszegia hungarica]|uniref:Uncharacterized protein n=1 Tax=Dioszegia hungarica TaxID=4972 RepID=A0AA38H3R6_9TREE|nr:uncharacterized protein MKK02DRAFT_28284 [Dioszegia hungarica]KAI9633445.1 hypothetical protein MKK02DRAFT_28284 [Dioszegia hungarica]